jgi:hypothetical protein
MLGGKQDLPVGVVPYTASAGDIHSPASSCYPGIDQSVVEGHRTECSSVFVALLAVAQSSRLLATSRSAPSSSPEVNETYAEGEVGKEAA